MRLFIIPLLLIISTPLLAQFECPIDFTNEKPDGIKPGDKWVPFGRVWNCELITYFFENGTAAIPGDQEQAAVRAAMQTWEIVSNVRFMEVCNINDADLRISWADIDGPLRCEGGFSVGGVFGRACPAPTALAACTAVGLAPGDVEFDEDENWVTTGANFNGCGGTVDLQTIAVHELGHSLGIAHTDQPDNDIVMRPFQFTGELRPLDWDDRLAVRSLYGFPQYQEINGASTVYSNQYPYTSTYSLECIPDGYTLTWDFDWPLSIRSGQGQRVVTLNIPRNFPNNRTARVIARLTNACGDTRTFTRTITIIKPSTGGGSGCTRCPQPLVASEQGEFGEPGEHLEQTNENRLTIYPNPVTQGEELVFTPPADLGENSFGNAIATQAAPNKSNKYWVLDMNGRVVHEGIETGSTRQVIPTTNFKTGVYLLRVVNHAGEEVSTAKFIVK